MSGSTCLPCGLTVEQVIAGLGDLAVVGLSALGQPELAALVPLLERLADDAAQLATGANATEVLISEVDAEQGAGDAAEAKKFGGAP